MARLRQRQQLQQPLWWPALWSLIVAGLIQPALCVTLRDVIVNDDNLSLFRTACSQLNILDLELDNPNLQFTIFAPHNQAMEANQFMSLYLTGIDESDPPRWHNHIEAAIRNHMVQNQALTFDQIFDGSVSQLYSMTDPLRLQHGFQNIQGATIESPNLAASNGVLHVINRVLEPEFFSHSFEALERQSEFGPDWLDRVSMQTIVDFNNARSYFTKIVEAGQTQVGCRIRALNRIGLFYLPKTLNRSPEIKFGEFLNASNREETIHDLIEYSLIHKNFYIKDLEPGHMEWIMSSNGCSHILVTKSHAGDLCFNDACVVETPKPRKFLASNGIGYVTDKCMVCSGVAMLLEYAAVYGKEELADASQFWETSEWNLRNLSMSIGNGEKITLLAAQDSAFNVFNAEDVARISTDKWKIHQHNFLHHNALQGVYFEQDFVDMWFNNMGKPYNITALSGENVTFDYDEERQRVLVEGGEIIFSNIKGIDGLLHYIASLPVPRSVTHTVYDLADEWANYTTQVTLIDTVFLKSDLKRLLPITCLFAPNEDWANKVIELEDISKSVLENMIFPELQWCAKLREMAGQRLESHNGQTWKISINETTNMPCFDTAQVFGGPVRRSCITECDILARNGVVHKVDKVLFFEDPETVGPQPPAIPTYRNPAAPTFYTPPAPPVPGWYLPRPTFAGPINPAYAAVGEEGHGVQQSHATLSASYGSTGLLAVSVSAVLMLLAVWA